MRFVSTAGTGQAGKGQAGQPATVDAATALLASLAPDGGLYLPESLPRLDPEVLATFPGAGLAQIGFEVARRILDEVPPAELQRVAREALDFAVPLVEVEPGMRVLELFHGPTLAFKDVGARFMARLFALLAPASDRPLTVLVATSGDTGSAVAQAFLGVPGTRVAVLYPRGLVSPIQECQFTTLGDNVQALAVEGTFDDCQRLVKAAFADAGRCAALRLTSANSINLARLLPQSFYYFHAAAGLPRGAPPPLFAVPSGNFGNLTAGLLAARMGLPLAGFVAATNVNDVVPAYLETGVFAPRPSTATISNAMDVGNPSNFARILHLCGGELAEVRRLIHGSRHTDDETRRTIREVFARTGYVLDPHGAVGWRALELALAERADAVSGIVLATAHPIKFREVVEPLIGRQLPLPERLAACLDRPRRALPLAPEPAALLHFLDSWQR